MSAAEPSRRVELLFLSQLCFSLSELRAADIRAKSDFTARGCFTEPFVPALFSMIILVVAVFLFLFFLHFNAAAVVRAELLFP